MLFEIWATYWALICWTIILLSTVILVCIEWQQNEKL